MSRGQLPAWQLRLLSLGLATGLIGPCIAAVSLSCFAGSLDDGFNETGYLFGVAPGFLCGLIIQIGKTETQLRRLLIVSFAMSIVCAFGSMILGVYMIVVAVLLTLLGNLLLIAFEHI